MANMDQLQLLRQGGANTWNAWRVENRGVRVDLSGAELPEILTAINFSEANLSRAKLQGAFLYSADFRRANLTGADFWRAHLNEANFSEADLRNASLRDASLRSANLYRAKLGGGDLVYANLVGANLQDADLNGCQIYGISAWGIELSEKTDQRNLVITPFGEPEITVDYIEVAQFIYLLIHNGKLRKVIDTITAKVVLILGRFSEERKAVLDAMREMLAPPLASVTARCAPRHGAGRSAGNLD